MKNQNHKYKVFSIDNFPDKYDNNCFVCDILTKDFDNYLYKVEPDIIVHCAAKTPKSYESANADFSENRKIDDKIINFCYNKKIKLIYMSGTSLYKTEKFEYKLKEDSEIYPNNNYLQAKADSEKEILKTLNEYVILRISSPYGPGQRANTVLKIFIENALRGHDIVFLGKGSRTQDFIYIEDISKAVNKLIESNNISGIFNINSGYPISMKDLAYLVKKSIPGCKSEIKSSGFDIQENYRALFDNTKAKKVLNWNPISIEEGIINTIDYFRKIIVT